VTSIPVADGTSPRPLRTNPTLRDPLWPRRILFSAASLQDECWRPPKQHRSRSDFPPHYLKEAAPTATPSDRRRTLRLSSAAVAAATPAGQRRSRGGGGSGPPQIAFPPAATFPPSIALIRRVPRSTARPQARISCVTSLPAATTSALIVKSRDAQQRHRPGSFRPTEPAGRWFEEVRLRPETWSPAVDWQSYPVHAPSTRNPRRPDRDRADQASGSGGPPGAAYKWQLGPFVSACEFGPSGVDDAETCPCRLSPVFPFHAGERVKARRLGTRLTVQDTRHAPPGSLPA